MGIDVFVLDVLLDFRGRDLGDVLCLGRQGFHALDDWQRAKDLIAKRWPQQNPDALVQPELDRSRVSASLHWARRR